MASSPFVIDETLPQSSNLVSQYPGQSQVFRDNVKSWLLAIADANGKLKSAAMPIPLILTPAANGDAVELLRFNMERAWGVYQSGTEALTDLEFRAQTSGSKKLRMVNLGRTEGFSFNPNLQTVEPINAGDGIIITGLTGVDGAAITTGEVVGARIANLNANKITNGVFEVARIPGLPGSKITTGTIDVARIPNLNAAQVTSGAFDADRIPGLNAGKIVAGAFDSERLAGSYSHFVNITGSGTAEFAIVRATGRVLGNLSDTASEPSFGWNGKPGIGMWLTAGDNIAFAKDEITRMTIAGSAISAVNGAAFTGPGSGLTDVPGTGLSGTIPAARLPTNSDATDWLGALYATVAAGDVGDVAFATRSSNLNTSFGGSVAGSALNPAQASGAETGTALSGTWSSRGYFTNAQNDPDDRTTVFKRVA